MESSWSPTALHRLESLFPAPYNLSLSPSPFFQESPWQLSGRASQPSTIAFIDSSVADYQSLAATIAPDTTVYILDPLQDAISQITQVLLQHSGIASVHLISHGSTGSLQFGSTSLNANNLSSYSQQLQSWATVLTSDADILLYGCEIGASELGQAFVQQLAQITGADVAASDDVTGSSTLGGDWELEVNTGEIAASQIFQTTALSAYQHILPSQLASITGSTQGDGDSWTVATNASTWSQNAATSLRQTISDDGRYVVFTSQATNLSGSDPNAAQEDVFLRDRTTGATILVSARYSAGTGDNSGSISGSGRSFNPVMSADGRYIAFTSAAADLVASDGNGSTLDVFLWDRDTRRTTLISRGNSGESGQGDALGASISQDGKRIVFTSAGNLFRNGDYYYQVFAYEWSTTPTTGSIRQVSVNSAGQSGNQQSALDAPALISRDGRYVVFQSVATNLIDLNNDGVAEADLNNASDIFVRDLNTNQTFLASVNSANTGGGNQGSTQASISEDGRYVAFLSSATNLIAGGSNGGRQVFVRDLQSGTTQQVSVDSNEIQAFSYESAFQAAISGNGQYVVFTSYASLAPIDTNGDRDVYVRDLAAGTTSLISMNQSNTGSGNGASDGADNMMPAISSDGRYIVFSSNASNLVPNDTNGARDVFLRDRVAGTTTLVSQNQAGTGSGNGESNFATLNRSGNVIAFTSAASNLVSTDTNGRRDAFIFTAGNQSPIANNDSFGTNEDTLLSNNVITNDSDPDNNTPLTVSLVTASSNGSLSLNANGTFNYTPNANYSGTDTFTYSVRDSLGANSDLASVVLSVTATNDAPVAVNDSYTFANSAPFNLAASGVLANDSDVDTPLANLNANLVDNPNNGVLVLNPNGSFTYTANNGFTGNDRFTYRVNDGSANSGLATVSLSVTNTINLSPIAVNDTASGNEDTVLTGNVLANDSDPDNNVPLTATIVNTSSSGSVSLNANGNFSYTPNPNFNGTDSFTYVTRDALGATSSPATVTLTVNSVNDAPSFVIGANQGTIAGSGAQAVNNWATGFNPGAPNESTQAIAGYDIVSNSNPGIFATAPSISNAGTLTYTPVAAIVGTTSAIIGVRVRDDGGTANSGTDFSATQFFTITISAQPSLSIASVNQAEGNSGSTAYNFTVSLSAASSQTVSVNYATSDGTARIAEGDYTASNGTLTFLPGETSKVISVTAVGDTRHELNETFSVNLSVPTNAQIATGSATGTLVNDDAQPTIGVRSSSRQEGNTGNNNLLFTVTLSAASYQTVSVNYTTGDGTATRADADYLATNGTLLFAPGETSKTVGVSIVGDRKVEQNETLVLSLQNPVNGTIATSSATGTILNDDNLTNSDFNQDGIDDIVWRNYTTGENQVWLMNSTMPSSVMTLPSVSPGWVLEGVGDFNQDGNPDLLWREYSVGLTGIWFMAGASIQSSVMLETVAPTSLIEGVGDLNGDGHVDIVWRDSGSGYTTVWYMNQTQIASLGYVGTVGMGWTLEALADMNNDGRIDLTWRQNSTGYTTSWLVYGNAGALFYSEMAIPSPMNPSWEIIDTGDYNRDGKTDVVWRNHSTGQNTIWLLDGNRTIAQIPTQYQPQGWYGI
ncbi:MAG: DUF4347 domain-containing protein [Leptolyngbyaceae cyanobacterium bins.302]|nr:DUF4347 domain-containing protein [Leptolyngbyaceae cyanobacterium bins.302]